MVISSGITCIDKLNTTYSQPITAGLTLIMISTALNLNSVYSVIKLLITANLIKFYF